VNPASLITAILAIGLVSCLAAYNAVKFFRRPLNRRFVLLGFTIVFLEALLVLARAKVAPNSDVFDFLFGAAYWVMVHLTVSFLIELTGAKRSRLFYLGYGLAVPIGLSYSFFPRFAFFDVSLLLYSSIRGFVLMSAWIRYSTDDRARRDGEWVRLLFSTFPLGMISSLVHSQYSIMWPLSIFYCVIHFTLNELRILRRLTSPENLLVIDSVFDVIILLDPLGRVVRANRRCLQLLARSASSVNGTGIERLVAHAELDGDRRVGWLERHGWTSGVGDIGSGVGRTASMDALLIPRAGEPIPVDLRILCLTDLSGNRSGFIVSATDMRITLQLMKEISDREYATRDLALSESRFSRMFLFNPVGIMIVDLDTRLITEANPAAKEIFERDDAGMVGKSLSDVGLRFSDSSYDSFLERVTMEGSIPEFSGTVLLGAQRVRLCRLSAVSFDVNRVKTMLVSILDVTQQEQMREALERKQKVETVGTLAGGIAHDFNNILAAILGHIGLAKMRVSDPHMRAPIEKAEEACLRAREMTRQLLAFSRGGKPVIGRCDTRQLIVDSAMLGVSGTSISCYFDIEKGVWPLIADKIQVGQAISNLVVNSVDAMGSSGIIEILARNRDLTTIGARRRPMGADSKPIPSGRYVEIRVSDKGPGVPESIRAKIFDPFFTTKEKGTGLGLSIVFSIVQNHHGAINLVSREGEGAVFSVFLPADAEAAPLDDDSSEVSFPAKKRVLIMDDDPLVLESANGILSSFGFETTLTKNGAEAVRSYREAADKGTRYDFCVLDLVVPGGMSGADCAREILSFDPSAFLLVSSGYSDDPILARYRDYGFKGIIPKPYTLEEFRRVLMDAFFQ